MSILTRYMTTPCTIVRRIDSGEQDVYGDEIEGESTFDTVCDLQQRRREEPEGAGELSVTEWLLIAPVDVDLTTGDAVIVAGAEYEVVGEPARLRELSPRMHHLEATLKLTAAAGERGS